MQYISMKFPRRFFGKRKWNTQLSTNTLGSLYEQQCETPFPCWKPLDYRDQQVLKTLQVRKKQAKWKNRDGKTSRVRKDFLGGGTEIPTKALIVPDLFLKTVKLHCYSTNVGKSLTNIYCNKIIRTVLCISFFPRRAPGCGAHLHTPVAHPTNYCQW